MKAALLAVLVVASCSERDRPEQKREPERQRRVIDPPSRGVRALPPHAIRAEGVGPYKLGESVARLLDQLPSGPRITQFTIPGIVHRDLLRAEDDAILIGAEPQGRAMFVAVVRADIARTEGGVHVGSTREELARGLGAPIDDADRALDPHIAIASGLKNARVLIEDDRITAIVVAPEPERAKDGGVELVCSRPLGDRDKHEVGACLSASGELVRYDGDELSVVGKDGARPLVRVPGLVFVAALRNPGDGRDDLVAIARGGDAQTKSWALITFHVSEGKLTRAIEQTTVFQLTAAHARWIGAELHDVELYPELTGRTDSIEVGGLLTTRVGAKIRDIVVITPVPVARRRVKAIPHESTDAGVFDPGVRAPR